jgi:hypothetical protein
MFANVAAGMAGGTAALAEMTQAPGQCCKVHSVAMFRVFRWSRIQKTHVRSQEHNLQFFKLQTTKRPYKFTVSERDFQV